MSVNLSLAKKIYEIENADWKQRKEWLTAGVRKWKLAKNINLVQSSDYMCWYIEKYDPYQDRIFTKVVPAAHLDEEIIANVLKAQPWVHY